MISFLWQVLVSSNCIRKLWYYHNFMIMYQKILIFHQKILIAVVISLLWQVLVSSDYIRSFWYIITFFWYYIRKLWYFIKKTIKLTVIHCDQIGVISLRYHQTFMIFNSYLSYCIRKLWYFRIVHQKNVSSQNPDTLSEIYDIISKKYFVYQKILMYGMWSEKSRI